MYWELSELTWVGWPVSEKCCTRSGLAHVLALLQNRPFVILYCNGLPNNHGNHSFFRHFFVFTKRNFFTVVVKNRSEMYLECKGLNPSTNKFSIFLLQNVFVLVYHHGSYNQSWYNVLSFHHGSFYQLWWKVLHIYI